MREELKRDGASDMLIRRCGIAIYKGIPLHTSISYCMVESVLWQIMARATM